jgi:hypothetical protein
MSGDDWTYYQGRIESLAARLGRAEGALRNVVQMVANGDSRGDLTRYILSVLERIKAEESKR